VLHEHMRADGKVSVSRKTVADALGWRHVQRVSERITEAHDAGFLITVIKGSYGRAAVWQAVFPDPVSVRATRTVSESSFPDGYDPRNRPGFPDTITKANPLRQARTATLAVMRKTA
jgi:hypothetical protein